MKGATFRLHSDNLLEEIPNLHLIILKFRFPPINVVQEAPNLLTYLPLHVDSMLLFADIVRSFGNNDWRFNFVKTAMFHKFDKDRPKSLNFLRKYDITRSSVLLPIIRMRDNELKLHIFTKPPRILTVALEKSYTQLKELSRANDLSRQEKLWIRKRDDIVKLALIGGEYLDLRNLVSGINSRSGGYRAIDISIKIPVEYLSTELAFFASISDLKALEDELDVLKKNSIGKKRDMGFGDLVEWKVYEFVSGDGKISILSPMIVFYRENDNTTRIITLRNLPAHVITSLKNVGEVLPLNMKMVLSSTKSPYWVKKELCIAPFSEFLLKNRS